MILEDLQPERPAQGQSWNDMANPPRIRFDHRTFAKSTLHVQVTEQKSNYSFSVKPFDFR